MRIEPPVSEPKAPGTRSAAIAAPAPLDDPPNQGSAFLRYGRIVATDIGHAEECYDAKAKFAVADATELGEGAYETFCRIREAAPGGARITARRHTGFCATCSAARADRNPDTVERWSARVVITFAGREWSREYAL